MKFPSEEFYNSSLRIASDENYRRLQQEPSKLKMWSRRKSPIKFIDVVGAQKTRTVATVVSAQQSKYNLEEVEEVVSCFCLCFCEKQIAK